MPKLAGELSGVGCVKRSASQHAAVLLLAMLCVAPLLSQDQVAVAQTCSADVHCPNGGRSVATCVGDTLIVRRSVCSGTCREVEERRENCGPRVLGSITCAGNTATRSEGGCNPSLGVCDRRTDREVCVATCSCRNNRLIISTGVCTPGAGCGRAVVQCRNGCTCAGEPRCL